MASHSSLALASIFPSLAETQSTNTYGLFIITHMLVGLF